ncbi:amidohydrolase [Anaerolineae bacterium CFX7]|nr:amidohydrolase [Anaerolineae bacterium CFX7]
MLQSRMMAHSLILHNGNFVTLDAAQPRAQALVLRGDEILYVGDDATARRYQTRDSVTLDLQGKLALPAFTDAHIHFTGFAQSLENVDLSGCQNLAQALARVRERVAETPPNVLIWGGGWNNAEWDAPAFPDKRALDAVAPNNPVILTRKDGHSVWLNSRALRDANITRATLAPAGGVIDYDADGEPSGILRENAIDLLGGGIGAFGNTLRPDTLQRALQYAHARGLTTIHNLEDANAMRALQTLHANGRLSLRVVHSIPVDKLTFAAALGLQRGLGDEWFRFQAVKMFADGSLGSRTAEMHEPYTDAPTQRGVAVTPSDALLDAARLAVQSNIDVWIHAIGDRAITRVLDVFAQLRAEGFAAARLRIEHVQHLHPSDVTRFRELNVIASMQPLHQPSDMFVTDAALGPARAAWTYAFKRLLDAGAPLAFGSDCPVEPLDPLRGIHAAVTRQNAAGVPEKGWYPEQKISALDAVRAYTLGAAQSVGDAARAGSLTVGKRGDVVVLQQNIFEIPAREIQHATVACTISGGNVAYQA